MNGTFLPGFAPTPDYHGATAKPRYDGSDYLPFRDDERLTGQLRRLWNAMTDGCWWTLKELAAATGDPEASISAQLRHLRKERFGAHTVEKEYLVDGLFQYKLTPNPDAERVIANAPKRQSRAKEAPSQAQ